MIHHIHYVFVMRIILPHFLKKGRGLLFMFWVRINLKYCSFQSLESRQWKMRNLIIFYPLIWNCLHKIGIICSLKLRNHWKKSWWYERLFFFSFFSYWIIYLKYTRFFMFNYFFNWVCKLYFLRIFHIT